MPYLFNDNRGIADINLHDGSRVVLSPYGSYDLGSLTEEQVKFYDPLKLVKIYLRKETLNVEAKVIDTPNTDKETNESNKPNTEVPPSDNTNITDETTSVNTTDNNTENTTDNTSDSSSESTLKAKDLKRKTLAQLVKMVEEKGLEVGEEPTKDKMIEKLLA